jgi:hypothetical protein
MASIGSWCRTIGLMEPWPLLLKRWLLPGWGCELNNPDLERLREAVDVVADADLLREMTRHNAAEFAESVAVLVDSARLVLGGEVRSLWSWSESGKRKEMEPGLYLVMPWNERGGVS